MTSTALIMILSISRFKIASSNSVMDAYSRISPINRRTSLSALLAMRNSSVIACIRVLLSACSCSSVSVIRRNRCSVRMPFALSAYRLMNISSISWLRFARASCSFFRLFSSMEYRCSSRWVSRP